MAQFMNYCTARLGNRATTYYPTAGYRYLLGVIFTLTFLKIFLLYQWACMPTSRLHPSSARFLFPKHSPMLKPTLLCSLFLLSLCLSCSSGAAPEEPTANAQPNILFIYVDDLGYGDLSCYGATDIQTPNIDRLASEGRLFTDAHCAAATCSPSRYALLTGNYAFRQKAAVLPGDAPLMIRPGTPTLPAMLKEEGYRTGVVGKWHLGLGDGDLNWNEEIKPGPLEIGFDYCFLLPSTGDRVPSVYVEQHEVLNLDPADPLQVSFTDDPSGGSPYDTPTGLSHPELLKMPADTQHSGTIINGVSRIGFMAGGEAAHFRDEDFPYSFPEKAIQFMAQEKGQPFFLYYAFHDIHVPRIVHPRFEGKSKMGPRGDAILQMDWVTGQLMKTLDSLGIAENTLVFFSSDNGPVLDDGYTDQAVEKLGDHQPAGPYRGGKYSIYEGGNRVPTILRWPGKITPGRSTALWNQVDLYASIAELLGHELQEAEAKDSKALWPALSGQSDEGRSVMLEEAFTLGLRQGQWKYIVPTEKEFPWIKGIKDIEGGISTEPQLYNLSEDPGEQNNLAATYPDKVQAMAAELERIQNQD